MRQANPRAVVAAVGRPTQTRSDAGAMSARAERIAKQGLSR